MNDLEQHEGLEITAKNDSKLVPVLIFLAGCTFALILVFAALIWHLNQPNFSASFPVTVEVVEGDSVRDIATALEEASVVRSSEFLYFLLATQFDATQIKASRYIFDEHLTAYEVASQLISGDFDTDLQAITVFEGESIQKIADRLDGTIKWFDREYFILQSVGFEGVLFPDTYFIPEDFDVDRFIVLLHEAYHKVIKDYEEAFAINELTEAEIITLASIVEREANSKESMGLVAGIFLNRLEIGMALQADASIEYVLETDINELQPGELAENLREIDSPYNTYLYPGLPPTPIGNPGRTAIEAVLFPSESDYLYYITGNDGEFYYAETYNQHLNNINTYLR